MEHIVFKDKDMSFDTFLSKLSAVLVPKIVQAIKSPPKERLSKREAIKKCGRGNIERWIRTGKLEPAKVTPNKHEYLLSDLERLQNIQQDYFDL